MKTCLRCRKPFDYLTAAIRYCHGCRKVVNGLKLKYGTTISQGAMRRGGVKE